MIKYIFIGEDDNYYINHLFSVEVENKNYQENLFFIF
jgi:hypothetical protein